MFSWGEGGHDEKFTPQTKNISNSKHSNSYMKEIAYNYNLKIEITNSVASPS